MEEGSYFSLDTSTTSVKKSQDFFPSHQSLNHSTDGSCHRADESKMVKNKVLYFLAWSMQRQHREEAHRGKEREPLIRDLEMKYESHRDIYFWEGAAIQITEFHLEVKSLLLLWNLEWFCLLLDYSSLILWLLNICRAVAAPSTSSTYIQPFSSRCQLTIVKYKNPLSHNYPQLPTRMLLLWTDIKFYILLAANCPKNTIAKTRNTGQHATGKHTGSCLLIWPQCL